MSFGIGNVGRSFNNTSINGDVSEKRKAHKQEDERLGVEQRSFEQKAMGLNLEEAKAKHEEALLGLGVPQEIIEEGPKAVKEYIDVEGLEDLDSGFGSFLGLNIGRGKSPQGPQGQEGPPPPPPGMEGQGPQGSQGSQGQQASQGAALQTQDFSFDLTSGTDDFSVTQVELLEISGVPEDVISEGEIAVEEYVDFNNIELSKEHFSFGTVE